MFLSTFVQELSNHVGLNVAQASSESIGAREIHELIEKDVPQVHMKNNTITVYHMAGKFGGGLNLVVWWPTFATAKLKSANISREVTKERCSAALKIPFYF